MSDDLAVHVIRKADLRSGGRDCYAAWQDAGGLALTPQKVAMVLSNPLSREESDPVQLIGTIGDRVIGRIDLLPGEMVVEGTAVAVLWGSSLFVPPEHRTTGMGLLLMFRMQAMHHTIAVCGISQIIYPIYQKLRWVDFEMPRYILLRRSRAVVERSVGKGVHARALSLGVDLGLKGYWTARTAMTKARSKRFQVERFTTAPEQLNERWKQSDVLASCHRSAAWLNWLLSNQITDDPRSEQALFGICEGENLLGYFLVKVRFHATATQRNYENLLLGSVSDWMIFEPDKLGFSQLIGQALIVLNEIGVDAVEVCVPQPELARPLKRVGFMRAGSLRMLFKPSPASALYPKKYHDQRDWRIRPVEGDHFFT